MVDRWFDTSTAPAFVERGERQRTIGDLQISNIIVLLPVASQEPDGRSRRLSGNGAITARRLVDDEYCGFLHYYLLSAPCADGDGDGSLLAIRVTDVAVFEDFRDQGVASALYQELREAHLKYVIGADQRLTDDGRRVATHYRRKFPDRHVGRFDTDRVLHVTAGPDDPSYEPAYLAPDSHT